MKAWILRFMCKLEVGGSMQCINETDQNMFSFFMLFECDTKLC